MTGSTVKIDTTIDTDKELRTRDGVPLKVSIAKALRERKIKAFLLVFPLLLFVVVSFVFPIIDMLWRSVENRIVENTLPKTVIELRTWNETTGTLPSEAVYAALAADLKIAAKARIHTKLGGRLNYERPGMSGLFRKTGRKIKKFTDGNYKDQFIKVNSGWGDVEVWKIIKKFSPKFTAGYFLNSIDAVNGADGFSFRPENERIYLTLFVRTLVMSMSIMGACLLLGYPIAFLLATLPARTSNLLMILVLLPFWTSLLVRTSAWKVLLQQQGVINDFLVFVGLVPDGARLELINNQTGTIIAMTHILLPFMILPLYSVMKTIPPTYMRAAKSLGATDWYAFWRVYFPQSIPGIGAGGILVFILSIGYYITPELVGGTHGTFISNRIAYHISYSLNWGLAAALGVVLLVLVMGLYWAYDRVVGIDNVKLG